MEGSRPEWRDQIDGRLLYVAGISSWAIGFEVSPATRPKEEELTFRPEWISSQL